jgi:acetoacetyl-CoA synthetase
MSKLLWTPSQERIQASNMVQFMQWINERFALDLNDYPGLYQWSVDHIADFWAAWWEYAGFIASVPYEEVIDDVTKMPGASWFTGARLNFAENLLRYRDDRTAMYFYEVRTGFAANCQLRNCMQRSVPWPRPSKALRRAGW